ncbi:hypothetical protein Acsp04_44810 [Actinomadura sp. NBRC 104425]|uniref:hypothetical protein n=1 Tax=Actinomadura sp. NBRC 104425 TaxID=3032204 RepID=UPI0024A422B2|nr:hypothetical protein [Actinomadura sp. NBRC 104425]GLZ14246.1 hypothetical protein Acsp04_44810 [Actinomadura sp. NBRC 104425]
MNEHELRAELLRLLSDGMTEPASTAVNGERGLVPLALDMDGDVAVVSFLRHQNGGTGGCFIEGVTFHKRDGEWIELGGGGAWAPEEPLARRPAAELGGHLIRYAMGRTVRNANRLFPWGAKWVSEAKLRASSEVAQIRVGSRLLDVPAHGHVVVVWTARRDPVVEALDKDGAVLSSLDLGPRLVPLASTA